MSKIYISLDNDELDKICFDYYGSHSIEEVLLANRDLAKKLPLLPAGTQIILPDIEVKSADKVRLWD